MASPLNDPKLEALLDRLHAQSDAEVDEIDAYFARRQRDGSLDYENFCDDDMHRFLSDKMVALDRDKAEFCYQLCRSLRATRVVEAGTSCAVRPLRSTGVTRLHHYYEPCRHRLVVGRLPGAAGYTTYLAPPISRWDEDGFSSCLACPCHRAVPTTPPE